MKVRILLLALTVIVALSQIQASGCGGSTTKKSGSSASQAMPPNGSANVPITQQLSWSPTAGATGYGLYFGTVNPPPFVITATSIYYTPTTIDYSTTYFWRINPKTGSGITTGDVWRFTTRDNFNSLPDQAGNPVPALNAANITISGLALTWDFVGSATSYNVYIGTSYPPTNLVTNTPDAYYAPVGLVANKLYYWRVDSVNSIGRTTGNLWMFTTKP